MHFASDFSSGPQAQTETDIHELLEACQDDPDLFNHVFLGRGEPPENPEAREDQSDPEAWGYWHRQIEVCQSVVNYPVTLVPAGNAVGKSYVAAGLLHWFLVCHPNSLVVATAPSQTQLAEVLWKEVERAYNGARIPLGGRLLKNPLKVDLGEGWQALAYSTSRAERLGGHHAKDLLAIIDEASGVEPEIYEAIDGANPSRSLLIGNPLRPVGVFYERCQRAGDNPLANLIRIPSYESPDIHLERSPRGLADRTWLEKARQDYGEGSLWWTCRVLAQFPDSAEDTVIPRSWLDRAGEATHKPEGPRRIAIDLATGNGGDRSVVLCRDANGILDLEHSNTWNLETTASRAALMRQKWSVDAHRVTWDCEGIGADFKNRLETAGISGACAYRGGNAGGRRYGNLRSAAHWLLRQRLDPKRTDASGRELPPFAIRRDWLSLMRDELQGLRYTLDSHGRICLEPKVDYMERLKHSPDFADTLAQSFGFPMS